MNLKRLKRGQVLDYQFFGRLQMCLSRLTSAEKLIIQDLTP